MTGVIGSIGGLLFGMLIARGIAASIGALISDVYGVAQRADDIATSPTLLATALAIGVATSIVAALIPARNAARVDPVQALQKGEVSIAVGGESRWRVVLAAICGAASVGCLCSRRFAGRSTPATRWRSPSRCCSVRFCRSRSRVRCGRC